MHDDQDVSDLYHAVLISVEVFQIFKISSCLMFDVLILLFNYSFTYLFICSLKACCIFFRMQNDVKLPIEKRRKWVVLICLEDYA